MHIVIDLRSLSSGSISGVENYIVNLIEPLLKADNKNNYTLFYNSFSKIRAYDFHFVNSKTRHTRIPNKLLNVGLKVGAVKLEKIIGPFDLLFMPNLNQFNISDTTKLAITVHDLSPVVAPEFYDLKRNLWHKFLNYKKAFERANIIFAVSEYTKHDLERVFGIPGAKIKVVPPGLDHSVFNSNINPDSLRQVRNKYGLPGDYVLFLNTIEPRKNLTGVIHAFDRLAHPAHLVIAGKVGWKYERIFSEIRRSKKIKSIRYLGYIPEEDKPGIIALSRGLLYPSFYEGFGFQPLEAMALGVPAIVSQVTALPEIVSNAAVMVDPYNTSSLLMAMEQVISNEQLRTQLIERGLQRSQQFQWATSAGLILEGLNSI